MPAPKDISQKAKGISLRFLIVAGLFLLCLFLFLVIADEMVLEKENYLDFVAFKEINKITNTSTTRIMLFITFFGSRYFLLPAYGLLIGWCVLVKKNSRLLMDVAAVGITSTIILFSLKAIFQRHRPLDPLLHTINGYSFPSGHSFSSFTFFGLLIYIMWKFNMNPLVRWAATVFLFLFASAIAISRVYLHVHYASDVIAGFCLCMVWLSLSLWMIKTLQPKID